MRPVEIIEGGSPLILGQPHGGTFVPDEIMASFNDAGRGLADTDWHITKLYDGLAADATIVKATFSRYVIDANRDPSGVSLYPGQNTTGLCPTTDFDGKPIYLPGHEPGEKEIAARRDAYHAPYHAALAAQIERVKARHGIALLYDCHSIRSDIPFLFDGTLPAFNIGDNEGRTCDPAITADAATICAAADGYDHVVNGRFKGGWTTRHYGRPQEGMHAIQMELAQRTYMHEAPPWAYAQERAARLRPHLAKLLAALEQQISNLKKRRTDA